MIYGLLMDAGRPLAVFGVSVAFMLTLVAVALAGDVRRARARARLVPQPGE